MQDRFKFRVWYRNKKYFAYNAQDGIATTDGKFTFNMALGSFCKSPDKYVVEQCTGLKDEYAQLIYEGDIVQNLETGKYYKVVYAYDLYSAMFVGESNQEEITCFGKTKVVGNIHENPELLEG